MIRAGAGTAAQRWSALAGLQSHNRLKAGLQQITLP